MKLDPTSNTPLHLQAEELLRNLIKTEEYQNGKLLPSEVILAQQLNISRNTLRKAIDKLVFEGILVRKKRLGTKVVKKPILTKASHWLSFTQEMQKLGIEVKNFELHVCFKIPTQEIKDFFNIKDTSNTNSCLVLERIRGNKDNPFVSFVSYFNPNIPFEDTNDFAQPLYTLLEEKYHITIKTSREEISARLAGKEIAEKLLIDEDDPILVRKRFVYDINNVPIEYNVGYYRADSFTYTIEAERI